MSLSAGLTVSSLLCMLLHVVTSWTNVALVDSAHTASRCHHIPATSSRGTAVHRNPRAVVTHISSHSRRQWATIPCQFRKQVPNAVTFVKTPPRLTLRLEKGARLETEYNGQPIEIDLQAVAPQRILFRCTEPKTSAPLLPTLHTRSTEPIVQLEQALPRSTDPSRFAFVVQRGWYVLRLAPPSQTATQGPSVRRTIVVEILETQDVAPLLAFKQGTKAFVKIDPISRSAVRRIAVERRCLATFVVSRAPTSGSFVRRVGISMLDNKGASLPNGDSERKGTEHRRASFILSPGTYYVEVEAEYSGPPSPIVTKPIIDAALELQISRIIEQEAPYTFRQFDEWLHQTSLAEIAEFSEFVDLRALNRGLPNSFDRLKRYALEFALRRAGIDPFSPPPDRLTLSDGAVSWAAEIKERDRPWLVVLLRMHTDDRDVVKKTEDAFRESHGVDLWARVLQEISSLEAIPAERIVLVVPVWCDAHLVYLDDARQAYRHGAVCNFGSASVPVAIGVNVGTAGTAGIAARTALSQVVPLFLRTYFSPLQPRLTYLTTELDFIEVIVRDLRGRVIPGGQDWERLQITVAMTGGFAGRPLMLRVTVDGRLASGLGAFPPDSQFTRDMEPQYAGSVSDYAKQMANALRATIEKGK